MSDLARQLWPSARRAGSVWLIVLAGAVLAFGSAALGRSAAERAISDAWHRAIDQDGGTIQAFEPTTAESGVALHPVSSEGVRPLTAGERVVLVTQDGTVHTLRVCDPDAHPSPAGTDCLHAFVSRSARRPAVPVPQRSL